MEAYDDWTNQDYIMFVIVVLVCMGIAFVVSCIYQKYELLRLKKLEIPLNS
jgi:uncharacterized membrane protein YcjF (UPF0283 family)